VRIRLIKKRLNPFYEDDILISISVVLSDNLLSRINFVVSERDR